MRHDYYLELSQGNRVRLDPIPASRGLILDRGGKVLANNEPAYQLELIREQVPNLNDTLKRLADLGLIDPDEIDDTRRVILSRRSFDSVPVRLRLTDDEIGRFAVHRYEFPGRRSGYPPDPALPVRPARRTRFGLCQCHQ